MNESILTFLKFAISAMFIFSATSKLMDFSAVAKMFENLFFFVTPLLGRALAGLLLAAEFTLSLLLLTNIYLSLVLISTCVLLMVFTVSLGFALIKKRSVTCNCFGQWSQSPISGFTIIRNLIITFAAIYATILSFSFDTISVVNSILVNELVVSSAALSGDVLMYPVVWLLATQSILFRSSSAWNRYFYKQLELHEVNGEGVHMGEIAPSFELENHLGHRVKLQDILSPGKNTLLVFTDSSCGSCAQLLSNIAPIERNHSDIRLAVIAEGNPATNVAKANELQLSTVLLQGQRLSGGIPVSDIYGITTWPSAILMSGEGKILSEVAVGESEIDNLISYNSSSREYALR